MLCSNHTFPLVFGKERVRDRESNTAGMHAEVGAKYCQTRHPKTPRENSPQSGQTGWGFSWLSQFGCVRRRPPKDTCSVESGLFVFCVVCLYAFLCLRVVCACVPLFVGFVLLALAFLLVLFVVYVVLVLCVCFLCLFACLFVCLFGGFVCFVCFVCLFVCVGVCWVSLFVCVFVGLLVCLVSLLFCVFAASFLL